MLLDRAFRDEELAGDAVVRASLGHEGQDLVLPRRQLAEWIVPVTLCNQLLNERRVDHGTTAGDSFDCIDQVGATRDPLLQEVSDPLAVLEQIERSIDLDMRREEQDPHLRKLSPDRMRRVETF